MKNYFRSFLTKEAAGQFIRLGFIGGFNTIVDFTIFNVLYGWADVSLFWSVTVAFTVATAVSYVLNRRWTFKLSAGGGSVRETVWFYLVNLLAWGATVAIVNGAEAIFGELSVVQANIAKVVATVFILIPKFAGYRDVVFGRALRSERREPTPVE